jgi:L-asparaginase
MRHLTLITTGGTIEKIFNEATGQLENRGGAAGRSVVDRMIRRLRLEDTLLSVIELMSKDSLHMTEEDRDCIVEAVRVAGGTQAHRTETTGIVILHGTDTLDKTGERVLAACAGEGSTGRSAGAGCPRVPIVLTGAMRPYEMTRSDALQNLTEAIFAAGVLAPGVYCVAHGRALTFPGVRKDRDRGTFVGSAVDQV